MQISWYVYIIQSSDDSYYTGITTDLERRFEQHANGRGAKYFNSRTPIKIVYVEKGHTKSSACKREARIKKLAKKEKEKLIQIYTRK